MALLESKTAVVTGGSSGIGRGIARGFAEHGAEAVVVADVREEPKEGGLPTHELLEEETDTSSVYVECDVTSRSDLTETVEAAEAAGGIDIMVNNAGIWHAEDFFEVTEDEYQRMMDINLKGAYFGSQIAAEHLVGNDDGGAIINISSIAGLFGNGDWPTYSASKGGLTMLTYSLAHKLGEHGIRVNAIHPGGIQTMISGETTDPEAAAEQAQQFTQMVPLGRYGQPDDIAGAATFLASDLAAYVTGESLVVDGGWTSWR
jgi:NAD(P)-dependent dehydrogenase (short-subunit alcohol dehydrogenase family)